MKFKIEIDCDNAAYDDEALGRELRRNLRALAESVGDLFKGNAEDSVGETLANIYDVNGNKVGRAYFTR